MKILQIFFIVLSLSSISGLSAQITQEEKAKEYMNLGKTKLEQRQYVTARYAFKQAYSLFAAQGDYERAVECGIQTGALFTRENYLKESLDLFLNMDQLIAKGEEKLGKPLYNLRFAVSSERLQVYSRMKAQDRAKSELEKLDEITRQAKSDSLNKAKLYSEAEYNYAFGQGDAFLQKLINDFKENKEYDKASEMYKSIIQKAKEKNNISLANLLYERYALWTDSVKDLKMKDELDIQLKKYDESLAIISEKDDALSTRMYFIIGLCVLAAILAALLIFGSIVLLRFISRNRILKKSVQTANEHNMLKSEFIHNISGQMNPTLNEISRSAADVKNQLPVQAEQIQLQVGALQKFCDNIQELSALENSLTETYETEDVDANQLCERAIDKIRGHVNPEVSVSVNAPVFKMKTNEEQLERILVHILENAALNTKSGYIVLDFKRRGARVYQFVITDSGSGIPEELRENLFKPFTDIRNLAQGDGLGLPICSLIATKLNGNLMLDETYTKGCRFILELRS